ncbi:DciA family protein [Marinobacter sp. LV10R510-11A]|uniref:DciA family protein n=1 Tax=Marinobacter sp. LV10R510-11A TaxID=1415568 RepID=UPI000BB907FE|nr:DciA family protein [Marinobacter sp. LV10R510-11A]
MKRKNEQRMTFDNLGRTPVLRELVAKANTHSMAEAQVISSLPPALAPGTRFVCCLEGELTLSAENAGKASQIRFRQHEIMEKLRENELFRFVWKLKVKVVPPRFHEKPPAKKIPLSKENARLLQEEAGHTKDQKLREVLEKLASHVRD